MFIYVVKYVFHVIEIFRCFSAIHNVIYSQLKMIVFNHIYLYDPIITFCLPVSMLKI